MNWIVQISTTDGAFMQFATGNREQARAVQKAIVRAGLGTAGPKGEFVAMIPAEQISVVSVVKG